jgi:hypothetical protein
LAGQKEGNMNLVIKLNNTASRCACGVCGGGIDPAVGPQIVIEGTWEIVCDDCARRHDPILFHALACWDGAVWTGPSPESDRRKDYTPVESRPASQEAKSNFRLLLSIDATAMDGPAIIRAVESAAKTISAFVVVVDAGIGTENSTWHPIRKEKNETTRDWFTFTKEHPTALNWPQTENERQAANDNPF